ncbi:uncharacterized protein LOC129255385 [Lytechinus pictus]|uniref:uncharacterized protein LOC129255385 n=1 Tax=Lytechinus pictus TaxID=7653 RepID=UPI0030B9B021
MDGSESSSCFQASEPHPRSPIPLPVFSESLDNSANPAVNMEKIKPDEDQIESTHSLTATVQMQSKPGQQMEFHTDTSARDQMDFNETVTPVDGKAKSNETHHADDQIVNVTAHASDRETKSDQPDIVADKGTRSEALTSVVNDIAQNADREIVYHTKGADNMNTDACDVIDEQMKDIYIADELTKTDQPNIVDEKANSEEANKRDEKRVHDRAQIADEPTKSDESVIALETTNHDEAQVVDEKSLSDDLLIADEEIGCNEDHSDVVHDTTRRDDDGKTNCQVKDCHDTTHIANKETISDQVCIVKNADLLHVATNHDHLNTQNSSDVAQIAVEETRSDEPNIAENRDYAAVDMEDDQMVHDTTYDADEETKSDQLHIDEKTGDKLAGFEDYQIIKDTVQKSETSRAEMTHSMDDCIAYETLHKADEKMESVESSIEEHQTESNTAPIRGERMDLKCSHSLYNQMKSNPTSSVEEKMGSDKHLNAQEPMECDLPFITNDIREAENNNQVIHDATVISKVEGASVRPCVTDDQPECTKSLSPDDETESFGISQVLDDELEIDKKVSHAVVATNTNDERELDINAPSDRESVGGGIVDDYMECDTASVAEEHEEAYKPGIINETQFAMNDSKSAVPCNSDERAKFDFRGGTASDKIQATTETELNTVPISDLNSDEDFGAIPDAIPTKESDNVPGMDDQCELKSGNKLLVAEPENSVVGVTKDNLMPSYADECSESNSLQIPIKQMEIESALGVVEQIKYGISQIPVLHSDSGAAFMNPQRKSEVQIDTQAESDGQVIDTQGNFDGKLLNTQTKSDGPLVNRDNKSDGPVKDTQASSDGCLKVTQTESDGPVKDSQAESDVQMKDTQTESDDPVIDMQPKSDGQMKDTQAKSDKLAMGTQSELDGLMKNKAESDGQVIDTECESDGLVIDTEYESDGLVIDTHEEPDRLMIDPQAVSDRPVRDTQTESDELGKDSQAKPDELVINTHAESDRQVRDTQSESDGLLKDTQAEPDELMIDNQAEYDGRMIDTQSEWDGLVIDREYESAGLVINTQEESGGLIINLQAKSDRPVGDRQTESDKLLKDPPAESDQLVKDTQAESDGPSKNPQTESDELLKDPPAESDQLVKDTHAESNGPSKNPQTESDGPVKDAQAESDGPVKDTKTKSCELVIDMQPKSDGLEKDPHDGYQRLATHKEGVLLESTQIEGNEDDSAIVIQEQRSVRQVAASQIVDSILDRPMTEVCDRKKANSDISSKKYSTVSIVDLKGGSAVIDLIPNPRFGFEGADSAKALMNYCHQNSKRPSAENVRSNAKKKPRLSGNHRMLFGTQDSSSENRNVDKQCCDQILPTTKSNGTDRVKKIARIQTFETHPKFIKMVVDTKYQGSTSSKSSGSLVQQTSASAPNMASSSRQSCPQYIDEMAVPNISTESVLSRTNVSTVQNPVPPLPLPTGFNIVPVATTPFLPTLQYNLPMTQVQTGISNVPVVAMPQLTSLSTVPTNSTQMSSAFSKLGMALSSTPQNIDSMAPLPSISVQASTRTVSASLDCNSARTQTAYSSVKVPLQTSGDKVQPLNKHQVAPISVYHIEPAVNPVASMPQLGSSRIPPTNLTQPKSSFSTVRLILPPKLQNAVSVAPVQSIPVQTSTNTVSTASSEWKSSGRPYAYSTVNVPPPSPGKAVEPRLEFPIEPINGIETGAAVNPHCPGIVHLGYNQLPPSQRDQVLTPSFSMLQNCQRHEGKQCIQHASAVKPHIPSTISNPQSSVQNAFSLYQQVANATILRQVKSKPNDPSPVTRQNQVQECSPSNNKRAKSTLTSDHTPKSSSHPTASSKITTPTTKHSMKVEFTSVKIAVPTTMPAWVLVNPLNFSATSSSHTPILASSHTPPSHVETHVPRAISTHTVEDHTTMTRVQSHISPVPLEQAIVKKASMKRPCENVGGDQSKKPRQMSEGEILVERLQKVSAHLLYVVLELLQFVTANRYSPLHNPAVCDLTSEELSAHGALLAAVYGQKFHDTLMVKKIISEIADLPIHNIGEDEPRRVQEAVDSLSDVGLAKTEKLNRLSQVLFSDYERAFCSATGKAGFPPFCKSRMFVLQHAYLLTIGGNASKQISEGERMKQVLDSTANLLRMQMTQEGGYTDLQRVKDWMNKEQERVKTILCEHQRELAEQRKNAQKASACRNYLMETHLGAYVMTSFENRMLEEFCISYDQALSTDIQLAHLLEAILSYDELLIIAKTQEMPEIPGVGVKFAFLRQAYFAVFHDGSSTLTSPITKVDSVKKWLLGHVLLNDILARIEAESATLRCLLLETKVRIKSLAKQNESKENIKQVSSSTNMPLKQEDLKPAQGIKKSNGFENMLPGNLGAYVMSKVIAVHLEVVKDITDTSKKESILQHILNKIITEDGNVQNQNPHPEYEGIYLAFLRQCMFTVFPHDTQEVQCEIWKRCTKYMMSLLGKYLVETPSSTLSVVQEKMEKNHLSNVRIKEEYSQEGAKLFLGCPCHKEKLGSTVLSADEVAEIHHIKDNIHGNSDLHARELAVNELIKIIFCQDDLASIPVCLSTRKLPFKILKLTKFRLAYFTLFPSCNLVTEEREWACCWSLLARSVHSLMQSNRKFMSLIYVPRTSLCQMDTQQQNERDESDDENMMAREMSNSSSSCSSSEDESEGNDDYVPLFIRTGSVWSERPKNWKLLKNHTNRLPSMLTAETETGKKVPLPLGCRMSLEKIGSYVMTQNEEKWKEKLKHTCYTKKLSREQAVQLIVKELYTQDDVMYAHNRKTNKQIVFCPLKMAILRHVYFELYFDGKVDHVKLWNQCWAHLAQVFDKTRQLARNTLLGKVVVTDKYKQLKELQMRKEKLRKHYEKEHLRTEESEQNTGKSLTDSPGVSTPNANLSPDQLSQKASANNTSSTNKGHELFFVKSKSIDPGSTRTDVVTLQRPVSGDTENKQSHTLLTEEGETVVLIHGRPVNESNLGSHVMTEEEATWTQSLKDICIKRNVGKGDAAEFITQNVYTVSEIINFHERRRHKKLLFDKSKIAIIRQVFYTIFPPEGDEAPSELWCYFWAYFTKACQRLEKYGRTLPNEISDLRPGQRGKSVGKRPIQTQFVECKRLKQGSEEGNEDTTSQTNTLHGKSISRKDASSQPTSKRSEALFTLRPQFMRLLQCYSWNPVILVRFLAANIFTTEELLGCFNNLKSLDPSKMKAYETAFSQFYDPADSAASCCLIKHIKDLYQATTSEYWGRQTAEKLQLEVEKCAEQCGYISRSVDPIQEESLKVPTSATVEKSVFSMAERSKMCRDLLDDDIKNLPQYKFERCVYIASRLMEKLFSREELLTGNTSGTRGMCALDPKRLNVLKHTTFAIAGVAQSSHQRTWDRIHLEIDQALKSKAFQFVTEDRRVEKELECATVLISPKFRSQTQRKESETGFHMISCTSLIPGGLRRDLLLCAKDHTEVLKKLLNHFMRKDEDFSQFLFRSPSKMKLIRAVYWSICSISIDELGDRWIKALETIYSLVESGKLYEKSTSRIDVEEEEGAETNDIKSKVESTQLQDKTNLSQDMSDEAEDDSMLKRQRNKGDIKDTTISLMKCYKWSKEVVVRLLIQRILTEADIDSTARTMVLNKKKRKEIEVFFSQVYDEEEKDHCWTLIKQIIKDVSSEDRSLLYNVWTRKSKKIAVEEAAGATLYQKSKSKSQNPGNLDAFIQEEFPWLPSGEVGKCLFISDHMRKCFFSTEELAFGSCFGSPGWLLLDPKRMDVLKHVVFTVASVPVHKKEKMWQICRNTMDRKNRKLRQQLLEEDEKVETLIQTNPNALAEQIPDDVRSPVMQSKDNAVTVIRVLVQQLFKPEDLMGDADEMIPSQMKLLQELFFKIHEVLPSEKEDAWIQAMRTINYLNKISGYTFKSGDDGDSSGSFVSDNEEDWIGGMENYQEGGESSDEDATPRTQDGSVIQEMMKPSEPASDKNTKVETRSVSGGPTSALANIRDNQPTRTRSSEEHVKLVDSVRSQAFNNVEDQGNRIGSSKKQKKPANTVRSRTLGTQAGQHRSTSSTEENKKPADSVGSPAFNNVDEQGKRKNSNEGKIKAVDTVGSKTLGSRVRKQKSTHSTEENFKPADSVKSQAFNDQGKRTSGTEEKMKPVDSVLRSRTFSNSVGQHKRASNTDKKMTQVDTVMSRSSDSDVSQHNTTTNTEKKKKTVDSARYRNSINGVGQCNRSSSSEDKIKPVDDTTGDSLDWYILRPVLMQLYKHLKAYKLEEDEIIDELIMHIFGAKLLDGQSVALSLDDSIEMLKSAFFLLYNVPSSEQVAAYDRLEERLMHTLMILGQQLTQNMDEKLVEDEAAVKVLNKPKPYPPIPNLDEKVRKMRSLLMEAFRADERIEMDSSKLKKLKGSKVDTVIAAFQKSFPSKENMERKEAMTLIYNLTVELQELVTEKLRFKVDSLADAFVQRAVSALEAKAKQQASSTSPATPLFQAVIQELACVKRAVGLVPMVRVLLRYLFTSEELVVLQQSDMNHLPPTLQVQMDLMQRTVYKVTKTPSSERENMWSCIQWIVTKEIQDLKSVDDESNKKKVKNEIFIPGYNRCAALKCVMGVVLPLEEQSQFHANPQVFETSHPEKIKEMKNLYFQIRNIQELAKDEEWELVCSPRKNYEIAQQLSFPKKGTREHKSVRFGIPKEALMSPTSEHENVKTPSTDERNKQEQDSKSEKKQNQKPKEKTDVLPIESRKPADIGQSHITTRSKLKEASKESNIVTTRSKSKEASKKSKNIITTRSRSKEASKEGVRRIEDKKKVSSKSKSQEVSKDQIHNLHDKDKSLLKQSDRKTVSTNPVPAISQATSLSVPHKKTIVVLVDYNICDSVCKIMADEESKRNEIDIKKDSETRMTTTDKMMTNGKGMKSETSPSGGSHQNLGRTEDGDGDENAKLDNIVKDPLDRDKRVTTDSSPEKKKIEIGNNSTVNPVKHEEDIGQDISMTEVTQQELNLTRSPRGITFAEEDTETNKSKNVDQIEVAVSLLKSAVENIPCGSDIDKSTSCQPIEVEELAANKAVKIEESLQSAEEEKVTSHLSTPADSKDANAKKVISPTSKDEMHKNDNSVTENAPSSAFPVPDDDDNILGKVNNSETFSDLDDDVLEDDFEKELHLDESLETKAVPSIDSRTNDLSVVDNRENPQVRGEDSSAVTAYCQTISSNNTPSRFDQSSEDSHNSATDGHNIEATTMEVDSQLCDVESKDDRETALSDTSRSNTSQGVWESNEVLETNIVRSHDSNKNGQLLLYSGKETQDTGVSLCDVAAPSNALSPAHISSSRFYISSEFTQNSAIVIQNSDEGITMEMNSLVADGELKNDRDRILKDSSRCETHEDAPETDIVPSDNSDKTEQSLVESGKETQDRDESSPYQTQSFINTLGGCDFSSELMEKYDISSQKSAEKVTMEVNTQVTDSESIIEGETLSIDMSGSETRERVSYPNAIASCQTLSSTDVPGRIDISSEFSQNSAIGSQNIEETTIEGNSKVNDVEETTQNDTSRSHTPHDDLESNKGPGTQIVPSHDSERSEVVDTGKIVTVNPFSDNAIERESNQCQADISNEATRSTLN